LEAPELPTFVTASNAVSSAPHSRRGSIQIRFHNRAHQGATTASATTAEVTRGKSARQTRRSAKAARARAKSQSLKVKVGPGDNLWQIARRHGTSVNVIKRANHIQSDGDLRPGQVLSVPSH
jgi:LysM repeat protein